MKRWTLWIAGGVLILAATGCVDRQAQKESKATEKVVNNPVKAVDIQPAVLGTVTDDVEVTGDITASDDSTIGSKQNNRVVSVLVKDGDVVQQGQLLAALDDSGATAQLKQAQAQVATAVASMASARSQVAQAQRNLSIGPRRSTIAVLLAKAQLQGSKTGLDKVVNGARPEERRQAVANLESAKANLDLQKKTLDRTKTLVDEGALAGQSYDQQKSAYDQAVAQVKSAQEAVNIDQNGSRPEDIDSARSALQEAQENLKNAEDAKKLDPLLKDQLDAANAQVESARAQLASARAQIQIASQAIADTKVFAPFSGRISGKPIQAGSIAGAGTAIVRIVGGEGLYFNGQIPSSNIDKVRAGMPVKIHVDGLPGKVFDGSIVGVNPLADSVGRLFSVRVQITSPDAALKAGMFARGTVAIRTISNAVIVPTVAIVTSGDDHFLMVVEGKKVHKKKITLGLTHGDFTQVFGISEGAKVVTAGQDDVLDGTTVSIKATTTALRDGPGSLSEAKG